ncbi:putative B3 domain-containing protein [Capsicum chacoense]
MARMRNSNGDDSFCFYKILFDPEIEELRIPSDFVKYITEQATEIAFLVEPCGKYWNIELKSNEDGMFIHDGWKNFRMEQHFEGGELLLFNYDGKMTFHVCVFDKNGLER